MLTPGEIMAVLEQLSGVYQLVAKLLYGSGLRLNEALRLRVKDLDFAQQQIIVRDAKGGESRVAMLSASLANDLNDVNIVCFRSELHYWLWYKLWNWPSCYPEDQ